MPLTPGTRLGRYGILAPLGAGGMGEVHRARDGRVGREVALKVLLEPATVDQLPRQEAGLGIVVAHPLAPGIVERIEALKASIPQDRLEGLMAKAGGLTPAAVLAMVGE